MGNAAEELHDFPLRLRDGRSLQALEVGKSDGFPVFHFHGNGSSRLEVLIVQEMAEHLGVRLIGLDRPGIGRSDRVARLYRLLDWPDDVAEVADHLGLGRFAVEGLSGGAPYALACASKIPHRLTGCALISPATGPFLVQVGSPGLRVAVWMLLHLPWVMLALVRLSAHFRGSDEAAMEKTLIRNAARLGTADQTLLGDQAIRKAFVRAIMECSRQRADAATSDGIRFSGPWGFRPEEVAGTPLFLWQGEQDQILPAAAAHLLAAALPHCMATFYPEEGHLSTFVHHIQEIWQALRPGNGSSPS